MKVFFHLIILSIMLSASDSILAADICPVKKIKAERLLDMNISRSGHSV